MFERLLNIFKYKPRSNRSLAEVFDILLDRGYADPKLIQMNRYDMLEYLKTEEQKNKEKHLELFKKNVQIETVLEMLTSSKKESYTEEEIRKILYLIVKDY